MNKEPDAFLIAADQLCTEYDRVVDRWGVVTADRDIKAANLQLLVEKVLSYDALAARFVDGPPYDDAGKDAAFLWTQLVDLARSLKQ